MENVQPTAPENTSPESCANCGNPAYLKGYPTKLCSECRDSFIKFPIPKWIWLFAAGIGIVMLFSLTNFYKNLRLGIAFERGKKAEQSHRYETAAREYGRVVKDVPDYIEGLGHLMIAAYYRNDKDDFYYYTEKLQGKNFENEELLAQLNDLVDKADAITPSDTLTALFNKYDSLEIDIPDSVVERHIKDFPDELFAKYYLGSRYNANEKYSNAQYYLHMALASSPNQIEVLEQLSSSMRQSGNYDSSIYYSDRILAINKESLFALSSKARTFLKMKRDKEALKLARQACDISNSTDGYSMATLIIAHHFNNDTKQRDQLVQKYKSDTTMSYYLNYALDIINNKEPFR